MKLQEAQLLENYEDSDCATTSLISQLHDLFKLMFDKHEKPLWQHVCLHRPFEFSLCKAIESACVCCLLSLYCTCFWITQVSICPILSLNMCDMIFAEPCSLPEISDQESHVVWLTHLFEDTQNLSYLQNDDTEVRMLTSLPQRYSVDSQFDMFVKNSDQSCLILRRNLFHYSLVCAFRDQNDTNSFNICHCLSELNVFIDKVPFIESHKYQTSWDVVVATAYFLLLSEKLSKFRIKIKENYNSTVLTVGEVGVYGMIMVANMTLINFFKNAVKADCYSWSNGFKRMLLWCC